MKQTPMILKFKFAMPALCLLSLGWFCVSCQAQSSHPNIFESPACEPPCWENITPGLTTKNDALNTLSKLLMVDQPTTERFDTLPDGVDSLVKFTLYGDKNLGGSIYFVDNKVSLIEMGNHSGLALQRAFEIFGEPQNVYVYKGGEYTGVTFLLPQSGVAFSYTTWAQSRSPAWAEPPDWLYTEIRPNVEINFIAYFAPDQYKSLLDSGKLTIGDTLSSDQLLNRVFLWSGYGSIDRYWKPGNP
jgi:hypothetical protein